MKFDDLDAKMRVFEQSLDQIIPPGNFIVARIDGRSFTRLQRRSASLRLLLTSVSMI